MISRAVRTISVWVGILGIIGFLIALVTGIELLYLIPILAFLLVFTLGLLIAVGVPYFLYRANQTISVDLLELGRAVGIIGPPADEVDGPCKECGQDAVLRPFPLLNADGGVYFSDLCDDCQLGKCQDLEAKARANTPPDEAESEEVGDE